MYQTANSCLTCFQAPGSDARSANGPDVMEAVRKHLWFTEAELDQAVICTVCWGSIDAFERFYVSVEKLYESRYEVEPAQASPESVTVKQEGHQAMVSVEMIDNVDEEPEIKEEIDSDQDESDMLLPGDGKSVVGGFEGVYEVPPGEEVFKEEFEGDTIAESMEVEEEDEEDPDEVIRKHVVLKCDECGSDGFDVFKQFSTHATKVHGVKKPTLTCCGNKYQTRSRLLEHVQYVLNPDAFKCTHCDQMFMNGAALKRHLRIHHGVETRTRAYNSENRLRKDKTPLAKTEEQLKKEEDLEKRRVGRLSEDEFMRDHVKFECVPCGETFICFADLFGHSRSEHKQKPVIVCCGNRYHSRPRLLQHVQSVKNPVAFRCELCFRCFGSEYAKSKHVTEMHATEDELKFRCDRCPKAFVREITWRKHMQDHEDCDNEKIKCGDCGKL